MFHQKQKMRWCWHENHVGKTSTCNKEVERLVKTCHRDAQEPQSQPQITARRWQMAAVNVSNCEYEAGCRWERAAQLGLLEVKTGMKTEATVKTLIGPICTQAKTIRQFKIKLRLWNSSELLNHKHQWRSGRRGPRAKVLFELVWCRSQFTWITGVVFCFAVGTAVNRTQKQETYSVNTSVCLKGAFVIALRHRLLIERTC